MKAFENWFFVSLSSEEKKNKKLGKTYKLFLNCVVPLKLLLPYNASLDGKYTATYYPFQQNSVKNKVEIVNKLQTTPHQLIKCIKPTFTVISL